MGFHVSLGEWFLFPAVHLMPTNYPPQALPSCFYRMAAHCLQNGNYKKVSLDIAAYLWPSFIVSTYAWVIRCH